MILIRYILLGVIGYLIVRSFINFNETKNSSSHKSKIDKQDKGSTKKVSKKIGEYIDYEETRK
jgi:hypothetical protein